MRFSTSNLFNVALLTALVACVDRVTFDIPDAYSTAITVDGLVTDQPGPYTVRLSRAINIDGPQVLGLPVSAKLVSIRDDQGITEVLSEKAVGVFETSPNGIQGRVGRTYVLRIETYDGRVYESPPETMTPVGKIENIYYEFESRQPLNAPTEYGYRIFIDAQANPEGENYLRWRFSGTYIVETMPQFHKEPCGQPPCGCTVPLACSGYALIDGVPHLGYRINPSTGRPEFVQGLQCTCCKCWVPDYESKPKVSDNQLVSNGKFLKVEAGYVPVTFYHFQERYRAEVTQMSLSKTAFNYWKSIQAQKEAVNSLFQPVSGRIPVSIRAVNGNGFLQGIFYAASTTTKYLYLDKATNRVDIRTPVNCDGRVGPKGESCLSFPGASLTPPADWN